MKKRVKKPTKSPSSAKPDISKGTKTKDAVPKNTHGIFRNELPIHYEGVEIGKVSIEFRASETFIPEPKRSIASSPLTSEEVSLLARMLAIRKFFGYLKEVIENDMQIALKYEFEKGWDDSFPLLVYTFYYPEEAKERDAVGPRLKTHGYEKRPYLIQDENILHMISSEGPLALRQGSVQYALGAWIRDEEILNEKMGKLKDALIKSEIGTLDRPSKLGRPKAKTVRGTNAAWIKNMYKEISAVLKILKKENSSSKNEQLRPIIDKAYLQYISSRRMESEASPDLARDPKAIKPNMRLKVLKFLIPHTGSPVAAVLETDKDLEAEFRRLKYEPNKLAMEIVAKLLEISVSKVHKLLYAKK